MRPSKPQQAIRGCHDVDVAEVCLQDRMKALGKALCKSNVYGSGTGKPRG